MGSMSAGRYVVRTWCKSVAYDEVSPFYVTNRKKKTTLITAPFFSSGVFRGNRPKKRAHRVFKICVSKCISSVRSTFLHN